MKKKVLSTLLVGAMAASMFAGCTGTDKTTTNGGGANTPDGTTAQAVVRPTLEDYGSGEIKIWVADAVVDLTKEYAEKFIADHPEYAGYTILVEANGEDVAANNVLTDLSAAADIFGFPQDQLSRLVSAGALASFGGYYANSVTTSNDAGSVAAAKVGDKLYAFPYTSDNGYFVYYDKSVIKESSLNSLEAMIADCEAAEKNFYFDIANGWYQPAFFFATECELTYDTNTEGQYTKCNIDYDSEKGLVAIKEINDVVKSPFFVNGSDAGKASNVGFMVCGTWVKDTMIQMLGDNYATAKLPEFKGSDGKNYQLSGFGGFKIMGVKPQESQGKQLVCLHLAEYLTSTEVQLARFEEAAFGPSNLAAQQDPAVQADEALASLGAQLAYTIPQGQYPGEYWSRATALYDDVFAGGGNLTDDELKALLKQFQTDCESYCNAE